MTTPSPPPATAHGFVVPVVHSLVDFFYLLPFDLGGWAVGDDDPTERPRAWFTFDSALERLAHCVNPSAAAATPIPLPPDVRLTTTGPRPAITQIRRLLRHDYSQVAYTSGEGATALLGLHVWPDRVGAVIFTRVANARMALAAQEPRCREHGQPLISAHPIADSDSVDSFVLSVETLPHAAVCGALTSAVRVDLVTRTDPVEFDPVGVPLGHL